MIELAPSPSKKSILDAARKLFVKYGYAGLSMRELAEECGLANATIYHYFQDKQEILLNVIENDMAAMRGSMIAAAAQEDDCIGKLRAVISTHYAMMRERHDFIINNIREIQGLEPQLQDLKRKHIAAYQCPIAKIIEDGIDQGLFRPLNVKMTVASLFGMINSLVFHQHLNGECEVNEDFIEHTLALFLRGVVNKGVVDKTEN